MTMTKITCRFPQDLVAALTQFANPGESQAETIRRAIETGIRSSRNLDPFESFLRPIESGDVRFKCFIRSTVDVPAGLLAEVQHLLDGGQKIPAIRMLRMKLGLQLVDAIAIRNCLTGSPGRHVAQRLN